MSQRKCIEFVSESAQYVIVYVTEKVYRVCAEGETDPAIHPEGPVAVQDLVVRHFPGL